jgi:hypothetical protein
LTVVRRRHILDSSTNLNERNPMDDGLYYDRNDELWYFEEGEGQAVSWEYGFAEPLIPEVALVVLYGPMKPVQDVSA